MSGVGVARRWPVVAALAVLGACGGGERGEGPPPEAADPSAEPSAPAQPARYQGVLILEGGAEFLLCDGTPLQVDGPAFVDMTALHAELTPGLEPMEGIFVDVLGEWREDPAGPWLNALEIRRAAREGWGCGRDEGSLILEAWGTEPFWTLTVGDTAATWRTPGEVQQIVHGGLFTMPRGGWAVEGRDGAGTMTLRAEFYPEPCRDAMSGAWSHLSAEIAHGARTLRGCAFVGPNAEGTF